MEAMTQTEGTATSHNGEGSLYYRGEELISEQTHRQLELLWSHNRVSNWVKGFPWNHSVGTGLANAAHIILTIKHNEHLHGRISALLGSSDYDAMEELVEDAVHVHNAHAEEEIDLGEVSHKEMCRLLGMPYRSVSEALDAQHRAVAGIAEPTERREVPMVPWATKPFPADKQDCVWKYFLTPTAELERFRKCLIGERRIAKALPFLRGISFVDLVRTPYVQVQVMDFVGRDWAIQQVLAYVHEHYA
jgi:hypothetical protein